MNNEHSLKMKNLPMGKLIFQMSLPAMFSMFIQALYNVVDTYYVTKIDITTDYNMIALGYAFPIQILITAVALGIGTGTSVMVAKKLGEQDKENASNIAKTGIILAIISAIIFFILGFIIVKPYMNFMSNNPEIIKAGISYLEVVVIYSAFSILEMVLSKIFQSTGRMLPPMFSQLLGAIGNIILDPIFIFSFNMGVKGAAVATVISQGLSFFFVIIIIIIKKLEVDLNILKYKFHVSYLTQIIQVGLPTMVMNFIGSITNIFLNKILMTADPSETANGVLVSYTKLQSFVFMPVFGLNQGGVPILSYNYGAKLKDRFKKAQKILYLTAFIIMTIGFLIFQFFPKQLLNFFSPSAELLAMGEIALRKISLCFIPAAIAIITTVTYQSLGKGFIALMMSLSRQALLLVPLAYFLSKIGGINLVWYAYPLAEVIVAVIFTLLVVNVSNNAFIDLKVGE